MVRVITKETFDEAVRENMELLDLNEGEAKEETIKQFKSQGVDLSNIIMECSFALVTSSLKNLEKYLRGNVCANQDKILHELTILKHEFVKDLSIRVHAGSENAYPLFLECLGKLQMSKIVEVLEALYCLMDGYPDLLNKAGMDYMLRYLDKKADETIIIQTLKWINVSVTKHEKNRSMLITLGIADKFRMIIDTFKKNENVIIELCKVMRKFVSDDDIRVVVGNPHEHARAIATEVLCLITELIHCYVENPEILYELLQTLNVLIVRNEFCIKVYDQNGVKFVLDAMVTYPDDERINRVCLQILKGLAGSDEVKEQIIVAGAAPIIVSTMNRFKHKPNVVGSACVCISALALRSPNNGKALSKVYAPDIIVECMGMYKDNSVIQKHSCAAIRNHISRCPEAKEDYLQLGVEELLNELNVSEGRLEFEAKTVLKELGCSVKLEEQWKGLGQQLSN